MGIVERMNETRQAREGERAADQESIGELVRHLSEQTSELARREVELAKAEMRVKVKRLGVGAGTFGGAGLFGLAAFAVLTAALVLLIATAVEAWVAALIVAAAYAAVAGGLALAGKRSVDQATPPIPEQTIESTKADIDETKRRAEVARG
jgi:Putative Actinobacterial Holin-X, holin superfamily III